MYSMLPCRAVVMGGQVYLYKYVWVPEVQKWERILVFNLCILEDFDISTKKNTYYFPR